MTDATAKILNRLRCLQSQGRQPEMTAGDAAHVLGWLARGRGGQNPRQHGARGEMHPTSKRLLVASEQAMVGAAWHILACVGYRDPATGRIAHPQSDADRITESIERVARRLIWC